MSSRNEEGLVDKQEEASTSISLALSFRLFSDKTSLQNEVISHLLFAGAEQRDQTTI